MDTDNQKELHDHAGQEILDAISKWHGEGPETRSALLILSDTADKTEHGISNAMIGSARELSTAIVLSLNAPTPVGDVIEKAYIAFYLQQNDGNDIAEDESETK